MHNKDASEGKTPGKVFRKRSYLHEATVVKILSRSILLKLRTLQKLYKLKKIKLFCWPFKRINLADTEHSIYTSL